MDINESVKRAQSIVGYSKDRSKYDFYTTPSYATEALLDVEDFHGIIWEPACGDGAISEVLKDAGLKVISTDLIDRGYGIGGRDFFEQSMMVDSVITNPPYSLGKRFVLHSLECTTNKVAMLLKLTFLESEKRRKMFETTPLARIHVFSKRVTQLRNGEPVKNSGMMCFAWFVWEHGYSGLPTVDWI